MPDAVCHNPRLRALLQPAVAAGDGPGLRRLTAALSHAARRSAAQLLGADLLPGAPEAAYWALFSELVPQEPKAWLGTFLKAAVRRYRAGSLHLGDPHLRTFAATRASDIDRRKVISALLPAISDEPDAALLLRLFAPEQPEALGKLLAQCPTPPASYHLFRLLQRQDAPATTVRRYCLLLMKRGDRLAFNTASLLAGYFGITGLPGTFSLKIPPYQLGRLDLSYEKFRHALLQI